MLVWNLSKTAARLSDVTISQFEVTKTNKTRPQRKKSSENKEKNHVCTAATGFMEIHCSPR
jgi:hypothetical protein